MELDGQSANAARVTELEEALRKTIAHIRALPLSPASYHAANAAEQVLLNAFHSSPPPCYEGIAQMVVGTPLIFASLEGRQLTLRAPDPGTMQEDHRMRHAAALRDALVRGTTITLTPR